MVLAAGSVEVPLLKSLVAEQYGVKSINSNQLTIAAGVLKRGSLYEFACVVNEVGTGRHDKGNQGVDDRSIDRSIYQLVIGRTGRAKEKLSYRPITTGYIDRSIDRQYLHSLCHIARVRHVIETHFNPPAFDLIGILRRASYDGASDICQALE